MKKRFTILAAVFALLAFLVIPMGMRGQTRDVETFTFSELGFVNAEDVTAVEGDNVTLTFDQGTNANNAPKYYTSGTAVRMYSGNTLEVALNNQAGETRIAAIDFTFSGTYSGSLQNWTGSETSVSFTNTASGQARIQVITVTFSEGGTPTPTTYTVTYDCNGGTSGCPENVTGITAGTSITLAAAPTKTDYTFDGWNDGSTTYEAGANYTVNGNVTMTAQWTEIVSGDEHWVIANLADLTEDDVFVIVGNNGSNYAMSNNNGTGSAPSAVAVTVTGNEITSSVASNIKWTVSGDASNGYTFYPYGSTTTWLYCNTTANSSSNNNMRVGTGDRKVFEMNSDSYLMTKDTYVVRYLSIYNNADWRGYINTNLCPALSFYKKMVGGTVPPSISADNVSVEYDAVSGSIAYTVNNGVDGGTMSAAVTEGDWLTLGQGTTSPISFTCTANQTSVVRTATVTLTYTYNRETTTANVIVTQAANPNAINNISEITAAGTYTVQGTIVAKSARGFIVGDGTGYVYYYNQDYTQSDYNIGDMVKLAGPVVVYGGVYEFNNSTTITTATSSNYVAEDPTVLTGEQMDARVASTTPPQLSSYVQYEGTFSINDTHYNITDIVGATTAIGSISYPLNDEEITALDGKYVKVTGYYVGISTSTYYNTMLGSIEEIASSNPSITAENVSIEYDATSGAIAYTIENPVNGGVLTAATESEWLTLSTVGATIPFTCVANTTASPRTATVTLTYTYNTDQIVTKNVTVTQAANPNTIDNISDITAAGTYTVQGTIVAISNRGFVLGDGTGYVYYYYGDNFEYGDYDIGDMVKLSGPVVVYGKVYEFNSSTTISYVTHSNYMGETPTVLSGADMDAQVASSSTAQLSSYVQYVGTLSVNGTHYNITNITGATTAIGSISYPLNADEIAALDGKQVKVTGYYVGISSSTYYNTMIGSIEENTEPAILLDTYNIEVAAEGGEGDINVTYQNFDFDVEDYDYAEDLSIYFVDEQQSVTTCDWITVEFDANNNVHYIVEANQGEARTAYFIVFYNGVFEDPQEGKVLFAGISSDVVTVTQAAYVAPFEPATYTLVTNYEQLVSGKTYIIVGSKEIEGETHYYAMGEQRTNNRGGVAISVNGTTAMVETAEVHEFIVTVYENGEVNDGKTLKNSDGSLYGTSLSIYDTNEASQGYLYAASSSGNQLKTKAEFDDNGEWGVDFNDETAQFTLVAQGSNTHNVMQFNYNNGSPLFNCYISASQLPVYLYVKEEATTATQTTNLVAGWNWFSTYVEVEDPVAMLQAVEASLGENGIQIKSSLVNTEYDSEWGWFGDLDDIGMTNEQMYAINVIAPCTVTLQGTPAITGNHTITINQGWNWIGFPSNVAISLDNAFAGFAQEGDKIKNTSAQIEYDPEWGWFGDFENLEPGQGYLYYSASSTPRTLVFNTGAKAN